MGTGSFVTSVDELLRDFAVEEATLRLAAGGVALLLVGMTLLVIVLQRRRRRSLALGFVAAPKPSPPVHVSPMSLGDWGPAPPLPNAVRAPTVGEHEATSAPPLTGYLAGSLGLATVSGLCVWLLGLALAPDRREFLSSNEWQFQPFYMAAHVVAVRMFALAYLRGYLRGISHLATPDEAAARALPQRLLGLPAIAAAILIASPLAVSDYQYLLSDEYERLGGQGTVLPVNYLMWSLWSVEWVLNAYIWAVLAGFLYQNCRAIRRYPFRAPIEIALHDRHYRPFLQMSAQGATILLVFSIVTVAYIWYTGGGISDYVGLMITTALLLFSFVPPWLLLRSKVRRAVESETLAMRQRLLQNLAAAELREVSASASGDGRDGAKALQHRLDAAVSILRISYLENQHQNLGQTEARDIMIKMLAPAASIGWQFAKSDALLQSLQGYVNRLF